MTYTSTVSTKGQVTIPEEVRDQLGIKPGDKANFTISSKASNEFRVVVSQPRTLDELAGCLHIPGMKYIPIEKAREMTANKLATTEWLERGLILKK